MPSARCSHEISTSKKARRIQELITITKKSTSSEQLSTKLAEVWADPECSITDARILLILGANPAALYHEGYGEKTLASRREAGSCCATCAKMFEEFLNLAQHLYNAQFPIATDGGQDSSKVQSASEAGSSNGVVKQNGSTEGNGLLAARKWKAEEPVGGNVDEGPGLVTLALDGGGMRGLVSIVCLLFASRRIFGDESLVNYIDWYAGCSTGAILALALAKNYTISQCFLLYWEMKNEIFLDKSTMKRLFGNVIDKQTVRMDAVLERVFGEQTFATCSKRVAIPTLDIRTSPGKLHTFRNYLIPGSSTHGGVTFKDAARASSAAPTHFHPHAMGEANYVDGSLVANCPLTVLFREHDKCKQAGEKLRLSCIISIGTGEPHERVRRYASGNTLSHRSRYLRDMATLIMEQVVGHEKSAMQCAEDRCIASGIPFFRISPLGINTRIDQIDDSKLMDMIWETLKFLLFNSLEHIDKLGATLRSIKEEKTAKKKMSSQHRRSQSSINFYA